MIEEFTSVSDLTITLDYRLAMAAVPPRLCPTNSAGMPIVLCIQCTAATMSATLDEKPPRPKSPSLSPRPVKSKRSVAMPC